MKINVELIPNCDSYNLRRKRKSTNFYAPPKVTKTVKKAKHSKPGQITKNIGNVEIVSTPETEYSPTYQVISNPIEKKIEEFQYYAELKNNFNVNTNDENVLDNKNLADEAADDEDADDDEDDNEEVDDEEDDDLETNFENVDNESTVNECDAANSIVNDIISLELIMFVQNFLSSSIKIMGKDNKIIKMSIQKMLKNFNRLSKKTGEGTDIELEKKFAKKIYEIKIKMLNEKNQRNMKKGSSTKTRNTNSPASAGYFLPGIEREEFQSSEKNLLSQFHAINIMGDMKNNDGVILKQNNKNNLNELLVDMNEINKEVINLDNLPNNVPNNIEEWIASVESPDEIYLAEPGNFCANDEDMVIPYMNQNFSILNENNETTSTFQNNLLNINSNKNIKNKKDPKSKCICCVKKISNELRGAKDLIKATFNFIQDLNVLCTKELQRIVKKHNIQLNDDIMKETVGDEIDRQDTSNSTQTQVETSNLNQEQFSSNNWVEEIPHSSRTKPMFQYNSNIQSPAPSVLELYKPNNLNVIMSNMHLNSSPQPQESHLIGSQNFNYPDRDETMLYNTPYYNNFTGNANVSTGINFNENPNDTGEFNNFETPYSG